MNGDAVSELERCLATLDLYANGADAYCHGHPDTLRGLATCALAGGTKP